MANPSLLQQQHQYSYPSFLTGSTPTNILTPPTFNTFSNNPSTTLSSTTFPYSSQPMTKDSSLPSITPTHNLQISSTTNSIVPNIVHLNSSPTKTSNNDIAVHYIGGFLIRESNQPFLHQKENTDQLRCTICQKVDFSQRFFDQEKKFCSNSCSLQSNENRTPIISEPIRVGFENTIPQQRVEPNIDEQVSLSPDHGLPADPNKWTVRAR